MFVSSVFEKTKRNKYLNNIYQLNKEQNIQGVKISIKPDIK